MKRTFRVYLLLESLMTVGMAVFAATYTIFLRSLGLNYFEVNLVNVICYVTTVIFEVPTGIIADIYGRKLSVILSCFFVSVSLLLYGTAENFADCAFAEFLAGVGLTLQSGAFTAWFKSEMRRSGSEGALQVEFSTVRWISIATRVPATILGGIVGSYNLAIPWFLSGMVFLTTSILASCLMKENKNGKSANKWEQLKRTVRTSRQILRENPRVRIFSILDFVQGFTLTAPSMQWAPYFKEKVGGEEWIGVIGAIAWVFLAFGAWIPGKIVRKKALWQLLFGSGILTGMSVLFTVVPHGLVLALFFYLLHEIGRGAYQSLKEPLLTEGLEDEACATILSLVSLIGKLGGVLGLTMSGLLAEYFSIKVAWIVSGAILAMASLTLSRRKK